MIHYGDIQNIKGYEVPIVDIITSGSPCQDLSTANTNRKGLSGERSGLFMEQIRIIKELHNECRRTNKPIRPRYLVWENVPGALSSGIPEGEDFRIVLEQTARIVDSNTSIPRLPEGTCWSNAGCILGDEWSIAWRVHDSQFWGVAQKRRRVSLVADFRGHTAPETLFERSDKQRTFTPYGTEWKLPPRCEDSIIEASEPIMIEMGSTKHTVIRDGICVTLKARMGTGGENVNAVIRDNGIYRLSPLEVERLQGYPDGWSDIGDWIDSKGHKRKSADSQRYKALGNSLCLPFWEWLAGKIVTQLKSENVNMPTMASLFDGLGGFPLVFIRCGCQPIWASEIEEFPIAVTKYHFGSEMEGIKGDIENYLISSHSKSA